MKQYPTIPYWNQGHFGEYCYAFEKLDGSNLRAGYSRKKGFYKFGTKGQLIDQHDNLFGKGILLFLDKYSEPLREIFKKSYRDIDKFTVFFEYFGEKSFAGWHDKNDDHRVVLFDIWSEDHQGFIPPKELLNNFSTVELPSLYYHGIYTKNLVKQVKESELKEGIVIKGGNRNVWMLKAKSNKWFDRLRKLKGELELMKELDGVNKWQLKQKI